MPPKRKRAASPPDSKASKPVKQAKQDGQKAVSKDLHIPLDEGIVCKVGKDAKVYVDDDDIIFDASMNQSNVSNNNNKFYRLQLIQEDISSDVVYSVYTRWGRLGEFGQDKLIGPSDLDLALKDFEKKFKDKTGLTWDAREDDPKKSKYTFIQKNYEDDDEDVKAEDDSTVKKEEDDDDNKKLPEAESKLPIQTQRLMELIFNENHFNSVLENIGYNQDKLPLGKLGKSTITKGFEHLKELASLIKHPKLAQNKYKISREEVSRLDRQRPLCAIYSRQRLTRYSTPGDRRLH